MTAIPGDIIVTLSDDVVIVVEVHDMSPMNSIYTTLHEDGTKVIIHDFQIKNIIKKEQKQ